MTEKWFVVTQPLQKGGVVKAGPYKTQHQAALARIHLEQLARTAYGLDMVED